MSDRNTIIRKLAAAADKAQLSQQAKVYMAAYASDRISRAKLYEMAQAGDAEARNALFVLVDTLDLPLKGPAQTAPQTPAAPVAAAAPAMTDDSGMDAELMAAVDAAVNEVLAEAFPTSPSQMDDAQLAQAARAEPTMTDAVGGFFSRLGNDVIGGEGPGLADGFMESLRDASPEPGNQARQAQAQIDTRRAVMATDAANPGFTARVTDGPAVDTSPLQELADTPSTPVANPLPSRNQEVDVSPLREQADIPREVTEANMAAAAEGRPATAAAPVVPLTEPKQKPTPAKSERSSFVRKADPAEEAPVQQPRQGPTSRPTSSNKRKSFMSGDRFYDEEGNYVEIDEAGDANVYAHGSKEFFDSLPKAEQERVLNARQNRGFLGIF